MNNTIQLRSWISRLCRRMPRATLTLAIVLVSAALAVVATKAAQAQTYTYSVLHTFTGVPDGAGPESGLVLDVQGNLYGTTSIGGTQNLGTVFKVNATGQNTVLHSFTGTPDGEIPIDFGSLAMDADGDLYGTTNSGGATNNGSV